MRGNVRELTEILTQELELTGKLLDLAKDARAAVVSADPELLAAIVSEQEEWAARLEVAEARRVQVVLALGRELGIGDEPRLKAIVEGLPREDGLPLRSLGRRLKDIAGELRRVGERNGRLLQEAVSHVDGFFRLLATACRDDAGYGADGREAAGRPAAVLDHQV
ncbi:MAG: flagellar protein FlgN [Planctomycetota bacterium]|jgi:flagellar biosynthesis/type III secretory pathway chaperone